MQTQDKGLNFSFEIAMYNKSHWVRNFRMRFFAFAILKIPWKTLHTESDAY